MPDGNEPTQQELIEALAIILASQQDSFWTGEDPDRIRKLSWEAGKLISKFARDVMQAREQKEKEEEAKYNETVYGVALVTVPAGMSQLRKIRSDAGKPRGPLHRKAKKRINR